MKKKSISTKNKPATKADLFAAIDSLAKQLRHTLKKLVYAYFADIKESIIHLHSDIRGDLKDIKQATRFLEKEIITNRLKIKELEHRLNSFTWPREKVKN